MFTLAKPRLNLRKYSSVFPLNCAAPVEIILHVFKLMILIIMCGKHGGRHQSSKSLLLLIITLLLSYKVKQAHTRFVQHHWCAGLTQSIPRLTHVQSAPKTPTPLRSVAGRTISLHIRTSHTRSVLTRNRHCLLKRIFLQNVILTVHTDLYER